MQEITVECAAAIKRRVKIAQRDERRGKKTINREMRKSQTMGKVFPSSMEENCAIIKFNVLDVESVVKFYKFSSLRNIKNVCIQNTEHGSRFHSIFFIPSMHALDIVRSTSMSTNTIERKSFRFLS